MSSLRLITYGSEPIQTYLLQRLIEAFPKVKFRQLFGTGETGIIKGTSKSSTSTFCLNNLESYKVPSRIKFLDKINFSTRYKKHV